MTGPGQMIAKDSRNAVRITFSVLLVALISAVFYIISRHNYLLFHGTMEAFSLVIAGATFTVAWNSRRVVRNGYLLFIGIVFLAVAVTGLVHTLAYQGMGVFPGYGPNLPTQLWVAGRYLLSLALLAAPLTIGRKFNLPLVVISFAAADVLILVTVFTGHFPTAYVPGSGLTTFKIASEYVIGTILLASIFFLLRKRQGLNPELTRMMVFAAAAFIVSDMAFTLYADVYGVANMIGHIANVVGYFLVYKALIETSLVKPYDTLFRELKMSETNLANQATDLAAANARLTRVIEERTKAEQEIARQQKRYHDTLDHMLEGCQIIDFNWKYVYVNQGATLHGRLSGENLVGRTLMEVYPGIEETALYEKLKQCMEERSAQRLENEFRYPNGEVGWFELSIQPVPEGIFILSLDISERKQTEKIKDEFLGMVSHELKNPLTIIVGALATVNNGNIPETDARLLLQDAVAEADELSGMIDNLLELSRQQASRLVLKTEPVNLQVSLVNISRTLGKERLANHPLTLQIPADLPPLVADRVRVERILANLIDNAIKYSPDGGDITVSASVDGGQAVISVSDRGIGISAEDQSRLFQSFERLGGSGGIKGTGLGLRVCKILVEAHGGRIWVSSMPQQGSTFYFTLPIAVMG